MKLRTTNELNTYHETYQFDFIEFIDKHKLSNILVTLNNFNKKLES